MFDHNIRVESEEGNVVVRTDILRYLLTRVRIERFSNRDIGIHTDIPQELHRNITSCSLGKSSQA